MLIGNKKLTNYRGFQMNEILKEMIEKLELIQEAIDSQPLTVGRANKFLERFENYIMSYEAIVKSRDKWRAKYEATKETKKV